MFDHRDDLTDEHVFVPRRPRPQPRYPHDAHVMDYILQATDEQLIALNQGA